MIPDQSNPQAWNRYSYTVNNPVLYNDPDGHCAPACSVVFPVIGVTIFLIVGTSILYMASPQFHDSVDRVVAKSGLPSWKHRKAELSLDTINFQPDDIKGRGPQFTGCKDSRLCVGLVVVSIIAAGKIIANKIACNASEDEGCNLSTPLVTSSETSSSESIPNSDYKPLLPPFLQLDSSPKMDIPPLTQPSVHQNKPNQAPKINPFRIMNKQRLMYY